LAKTLLFLVHSMISEPQFPTTITIAPQEGPQTLASESDADILIYGGAAGGGKSWLLINQPLLHIKIPGFRGGIFRRTYPMIKGQGGLWDEARETYPLCGARMREGSDLDATFPSGANIAFLHLQHEKTKYDYQGHQFAYLAFDELTHFTETQFFYLLTRNRTKCGIRAYCRATCNPDAGSWVAEFLEWWIDDDGFPIPERAGHVRFFVRNGERDEITWGETKQELIDQFPGEYDEDDIMSVTFIPAMLDDNPALLQKDPKYRAKLKAQPALERRRLEQGNWKQTEGAIINPACFHRFRMEGSTTIIEVRGIKLELKLDQFRRFATIDTAGTSKEKEREEKGDPSSYSVCAIWDYYKHRDRISGFDILVLRHVWRGRVGWGELKTRMPSIVRSWSVPVSIIENAHYGKPLYEEMTHPPQPPPPAAPIPGLRCELISTKLPGMDDTSRGAKLERAIASGLLTRLEDIGIWIPETGSASWIKPYLRELTTWTGLPKETADQIDVSSYAAYHAKNLSSSWGGLV
jgi:hypothetical protein